MKRIIRAFAVYAFILWVIATYIGGIEFGGDPKILLSGALALTLAELFLKPIINLLLLPFNLVTLGVFRWVSNGLMLYIATLLVSGFSVVPFTYPGFSSNLFIIPSLELGLIGAYIFLSFTLSIIASFVFWLVH
ncbi:MAG: phage holin family protein [Candidatus Blackburnbacteria bacterium]|nr:phage holin family protein [Candidatus Blackburnbacteria bacterium]